MRELGEKGGWRFNWAWCHFELHTSISLRVELESEKKGLNLSNQHIDFLSPRKPNISDTMFWLVRADPTALEKQI